MSPFGLPLGDERQRGLQRFDHPFDLRRAERRRDAQALQLRIGDDDATARVAIRVRNDVAQLGVVVDESAGAPRGNVRRLDRTNSQLSAVACSHGFAAMQTHCRGGGIGSRHVDRAFGYSNADLAAAPTNLELRADHADLDVTDRHREGPSGIASDGEIGVAADDRRATHACP